MIITNSDYLVNFVIPQGPTGPTGPIGPSTGLAAYGGKYNNTSQVLNIGLGTQTQVPLANNMPNLNTTYTPTNSITVSQAGTYEINYYSNVSAALATTVTFAVRNNGTNIPSTIISRALSVGVGSIYSGSVLVQLPANTVIDMAVSALLAVGVTSTYTGSTIVTLAAGDVLDMAVSALLAVGLTLGTGVNATLSIKKLN